MTANQTDKPGEQGVAKSSQPATTRKPAVADGLDDRKASSGNRYSDTNSPGAEGNNPSHLSGRTFTRKVPKKP